MFLPRSGVDAEQLLVDCGVCRHNGCFPMEAPFVLHENDAAAFQRTGPQSAAQNLLVEDHGEIGLITAIGDAMGPNSDPVAAGAGDAAWRWLDFGRDDLHGPDPVAHFGGDTGEGLATLLGALSGVADNLDDVFAQLYRRLALG
jgi:hypothetical protein